VVVSFSPARHRCRPGNVARTARYALAIATWATRLSAAAIIACTAGEALAQSVLPILVYHQIRVSADGPSDGPTVISLARFESQMRYLQNHGYVTLTTDQVIDFITEGKAPSERIVAIHFDDGWKSALAALPILDRFIFNAAFWIISGTGIGWPHVDWGEVQMLARRPGVEIYSHTMTHPWKDGETLVDWIAGRTPDRGIDEARSELIESRRVLEERLARPVPYLAWPRGIYDDTLIRLAREAGYRALFTIDDGVNRHGGDPLRIRRTIIHGGCDDEVFAQILFDGRYRECNSRMNSTQK
jgi:peptidoglycan/xylan/chitin deacetylase (PgdA/CDA1 family)